MEPANRGLTPPPGSRSLSLCFSGQAQTKQRGDQQRRLRSIAANRIAGDEHDSTPAARCGDDPSLIRSGPEQRRRESRDGSGHRGAEAAFTARLRTREKPHFDRFRRRLLCSTLAAVNSAHQDFGVEDVGALRSARLEAIPHETGGFVTPDGAVSGGRHGPDPYRPRRCPHKRSRPRRAPCRCRVRPDGDAADGEVGPPSTGRSPSRSCPCAACGYPIRTSAFFESRARPFPKRWEEGRVALRCVKTMAACGGCAPRFARHHPRPPAA